MRRHRRDPGRTSWRSLPAVLALFVSACKLQAFDDPAMAARAFLLAANRGDCERAYAMFSSATQEHIRREVRRALREAEVILFPLTPETRYCDAYFAFKWRSVRTVSNDGQRARVELTYHSGSRLPGIPFLASPYQEFPGTLALVREDGGWKVERPPAPLGREGVRLVEVGDVDVHHYLRGDPNRERIDAVTLVDTPRSDLDRLLMEPERWARLLPEVTDVEVLSSEAGYARLRLHFSDGARVAEVQAKPYGSLVDPKLPWATLQITADEDELLYVATFKLRPRFAGGTWMEFGVVIEPRQWPEDLARRMLSYDRIAQVLAP